MHRIHFARQITLTFNLSTKDGYLNKFQRESGNSLGVFHDGKLLSSKPTLLVPRIGITIPKSPRTRSTKSSPSPYADDSENDDIAPVFE